jgi:molybdopterin-synthase adenylyltransferase
VKGRYDLSSLADALASSGELNVTEFAAGGTVPFITGDTVVEGRDISLRIELRPPFPAARPFILLLNPSALERMPHVDSSGEVCYLSHEGTLLNWRRPNDLTVECVQRAKRVLAAGLRGENDGDYADELVAHWRQGQVDPLLSVVEPGTQVCEIVAAQIGDHTILGRSVADVESFENHQLKHVTRHTALFLPLADASAFTPPPDPTDLPALRGAIWRGLSEADSKALRRALRHRKKRSDYVVIQVPRPSGAPALVGLLFEGMSDEHALSPGGSADTTKPLMLLRCDREYLLPRGGASIALRERHVCVVGCGSVGSRIVEQLVRAGVASLLLVDFDSLGADNTFRHLLGRDYWGQNKAEALSSWVAKAVPYTCVKAFTGTLTRVLTEVPAAELAALDLMILATGDPTIELDANAALSGHDRPPMLFTWLEPLGIGGHALLSMPDAPGCLECLHTDAAGAFVENRLSFAAADQTFSRDLSGCGSSFAPFSNLHASRTAALASELALDCLDGTVSRSCVASWKGNARDFLAAGFTLSERYDAASEQRVEDFEAPMCPVCGRGRLFGV